MSVANRYTGLINKYRDYLPISDDTRIISLGEGNTPLIRLKNIPKLIGKDVDIYVKYEGLNPTGSFKDRGMTMAVAKAVEDALHWGTPIMESSITLIVDNRLYYRGHDVVELAQNQSVEAVAALIWAGDTAAPRDQRIEEVSWAGERTTDSRSVRRN